MRIGLVQTRTPATQAAALEHTLPLVREAAARGAALIATPEGSNLLQKDKAKLFAALTRPEEDPFVQGMVEAAREHGVWLLVGSALVRRADGKCANRSMLIDPRGAVAATYDKLHMFDVDLPTGESARESESYEPGDRAVAVQAGEARLGLSIC